MPMRVHIEFYRPEWRGEFEREADVLQSVIGDKIVHIHHIGSTSIPGIYAKPIIDLLIEAENLNAIDERNSEMSKIGYEAMGEFGIPGRRYFRKENVTGLRTHHVHVFRQGDLEVQRHLAFRDFLKASPDWARKYSDLKRQLVEQYPDSIEMYMDGKDPFIKEVEQLALAWRQKKD